MAAVQVALAVAVEGDAVNQLERDGSNTTVHYLSEGSWERFINQRTNQNIAPINEAWNPGHTDIVKLLLAQVYILYI